MTGDARSERRGQTYERLLRQERLILDVTEQLAGALENSGVTRAELARRMGRTPGFVSQVLNGGRNLTLRTIADIAGALSLRPSLKVACERTNAPARPRMTVRVHEDTHRIGPWIPQRPLVTRTAQPVRRVAESVRGTGRYRAAAVA
ncbi:MAG: helix-turn-helix transcriptional regulator [Acidobacteria bacterium]|nr:helix-turn-helix transcriptional regulator [Acidobacteriota bacterium]